MCVYVRACVCECVHVMCVCICLCEFFFFSLLLLQRAVLKFANYTGAQPVAGRFTPGTFTNQIQAAFKEPRLLVVTDPRADHQVWFVAARGYNGSQSPTHPPRPKAVLIQIQGIPALEGALHVTKRAIHVKD